MENLNWIRPMRHGNRKNTDGRDIAITVTKNDVFNMTFYRGAYRKISTRFEYVTFAFGNRNTRLYICEAENGHDGYKLTVVNGHAISTDARRISCKNDMLGPNIAALIGDYILEWDKDKKLYYIDLTKKLP